MLLAASRQAATRSGEASKARRLAEDAYWAEFEASDMEAAVRRHLGLRAGRRARAAVPPVPLRGPRGRPSAVVRSASWTTGATTCCSTWSRPPRELNDKGVTDRSHIDANRGDLRPSSVAVALTDLGGPQADSDACSRPSGAGSTGSYEAADRDGPDEASSELTSVYMNDFEPIERYLLGRSPQSVRPLEIQFNAIRGEISSGLKGEALADAARSAGRRRSRPWSPSSRPGRSGASARRSSRR